MEMMTRSVLSTARSGWVRASTCRRTLSSPSALDDSSAVAKANARLERPEPGGPVMSQEWVIDESSLPPTREALAAASKTAMASA